MFGAGLFGHLRAAAGWDDWRSRTIAGLAEIGIEGVTMG